MGWLPMSGRKTSGTFWASLRPRVLFLLSFMPNAYPEGPKIEKIQDFAPGLKFSSDQSQIEIFNRD